MTQYPQIHTGELIWNPKNMWFTGLWTLDFPEKIWIISDKTGNRVLFDELLIVNYPTYKDFYHGKMFLNLVNPKSNSFSYWENRIREKRSRK